MPNDTEPKEFKDVWNKSMRGNIGVGILQDGIKWCKTKENHKWVVLILFLFIGDIITTWIGLHYSLMRETNLLMIYLLSICPLESALLILTYLKYVLLELMIEMYKILPEPYNYCMYYTVLSLSVSVVTINTYLIIAELLI